MAKVSFCAFIQYLENLHGAAKVYFSWSGYNKNKNYTLIFIFKIFVKVWAQLIKMKYGLVELDILRLLFVKRLHPSKNSSWWRRTEDVFKTSSRRRLATMFWRRLQYVFIKTNVCWDVASWQIINVISPIQQVLWTPKLIRWWFMT